jgi:hypothetical protein
VSGVRICIGVALAGIATAGALTVRSCNEHQRQLERIAIEAVAYEAGMADALRLAPAASPADCSAAPLPAELAALAQCRATFDDYRRTEAANRVNARLLGINEGMRIGREDWYACGAWERERFR